MSAHRDPASAVLSILLLIGVMALGAILIIVGYLGPA
jgi:hypothetical protein